MTNGPSNAATWPRDPRQEPPYQDHQRQTHRRGGDHHRHHRIESKQDHAETGSNTTTADVTSQGPSSALLSKASVRLSNPAGGVVLGWNNRIRPDPPHTTPPSDE